MLNHSSDERGSDFPGVRLIEPDSLLGGPDRFEVGACQDEREVKRGRKRIGRTLFRLARLLSTGEQEGELERVPRVSGFGCAEDFSSDATEPAKRVFFITRSRC